MFALAIILVTIGLPLYNIYASNKAQKEAKGILDEFNLLKKENETTINNLDARVKFEIKNLQLEKAALFKNVEEELKEKFERFLLENTKKRIDQALINLASEVEDFRNRAIDYLVRVPYDEFSDQHLFKINKILRRQDLDAIKIEALASIIYSNFDEYSEDFFISIASNPKLNTKNTRYYAYLFFAKFGLVEYKSQFVATVLSSSNPTQDYIDIISWFTSIYDPQIIEVINFAELNNNKRVDKNQVFEAIEDWYFYDKYKVEIGNSLIYKLLNK